MSSELKLAIWDIDGTIVNKLLGREIDEQGKGLWRPIYTDDIITHGAQPMFRSTETGRFTKATDPSAIRDQQTANWFLYETMMSLGDADIHVDTDPPDDPSDGDMWYDTVRLELFVYAEGAWLPCSPLGARVDAGEVLQAEILSRVEAGETKQAQIETSVDSKLGKDERNAVTEEFRILGDGKTFISAANNELGLYNVRAPTNGPHAANKDYVDDEIGRKIEAIEFPESDVDKAYVDQQDDALEARIVSGEETQQTLANKITALEGVVGEHSYIFTSNNGNVRQGEFNIKDGVMQLTNSLSSASYISLAYIDRNGNAVDLDRISENDVLRLASFNGQAAELKLGSGSNGVFAFTKISGDLDRLSELPYEFILLSSFDPAGLATIDYVDAQDDTKLSKTGGTLTGALTLKRTDDVSYWNYITSDTPKAWQSGENTHGLILRVGTTNTYKQQFKIQGRSNKDLFEIHDDGKAVARLEGNLNVKNELKENGNRVATRSYVDDEIGKITTPSLSVAQHAINCQPPGVEFRYQSGSSNLSPHNFQLWESGGSKRMRISNTGYSIDWLDSGMNQDYHMSNGPYFSIYFQPSIASTNDRVKWRQRWHGRVERIDWHTDDILVYVSSWYSNGSLSPGALYFITIGGIL